MRVINLNSIIKFLRKIRYKIAKWSRKANVQSIIQMMSLRDIERRKRIIVLMIESLLIVLVLTLAVRSHHGSGQPLSKSNAASVTQTEKETFNKLNQIESQLNELQKLTLVMTNESKQEISGLNNQLSVISNVTLIGLRKSVLNEWVCMRTAKGEPLDFL